MAEPVQDDGNLPSNLGKADVVLLGVSRSSKTPLSVYLAQQFGYRVRPALPLAALASPSMPR